MKERTKKYWIIAASRDHVQTGVNEGIAQACHGKAAPLKRIRKGDFVIFYSGKAVFGKTDKCQCFTAIGKARDEDIFQYQMTADFRPFRRRIDFLPAKEVSILPLIDQLDFIQNKQKWGYPFRWGFFEIKEHDFHLISCQMLDKEYVSGS